MANLRETVLTSAPAVENGGFDWAGLHARFAAAHAARGELGHGESRRPLPVGGFENWMRQSQGRSGTFHAVNPTGLADGKPLGANKGDTADPTSAGGRGQ